MNMAYLTSDSGDLPTAMKSLSVQGLLTTPVAEKGKVVDRGPRGSSNHSNAGDLLIICTNVITHCYYPLLFFPYSYWSLSILLFCHIIISHLLLLLGHIISL